MAVKGGVIPFYGTGAAARPYLEADRATADEYYLEAGAVLRPETTPSVLDLAEESVRALGMPLSA